MRAGPVVMRRGQRQRGAERSTSAARAHRDASRDVSTMQSILCMFAQEVSAATLSYRFRTDMAILLPASFLSYYISVCQNVIIVVSKQTSFMVSFARYLYL